MKHRLFLVGSITSVLVVSLLMAEWLVTDHRPHSSSPKPASPTASGAKAVVNQSLTGKYLLSGDVFWGRGMDYYAQRSPLGLAWPFSGLKLFHPEKYDGWISDMECPVTDRVVPYQTQVDKLILQCPSKYTAEAAKYFTAFTLANNHTANTGPAGFADTRTNLAKAGIQFFGHYDESQVNDLCEVVGLPVDGRKDRFPVAMCGYHWLDGPPTAAEAAQITKYAKYFPVWVFPHGGTEYATHHSDAQQVLYRHFIDLGADAVFGDHPHVVQDTEAYKGKLIVYDFGNLIYDQWFDNEVTKSLIVNMTFSAAVGSNIQKYLDMGKTCLKFKDNCYAMARQQDLKAPKLTYKYSLLAGDSSNANLDTRVKKPSSPAVYQWLLKRAGWSETAKNLQ